MDNCRYDARQYRAKLDGHDSVCGLKSLQADQERSQMD
jgi:hypothetical protein